MNNRRNDDPLTRHPSACYGPLMNCEKFPILWTSFNWPWNSSSYLASYILHTIFLSLEKKIQNLKLHKKLKMNRFCWLLTSKNVRQWWTCFIELCDQHLSYCILNRYHHPWHCSVVIKIRMDMYIFCEQKHFKTINNIHKIFLKNIYYDSPTKIETYTCCNYRVSVIHFFKLHMPIS